MSTDDTSNNVVFGRYREIAKLIIGFLLTSIIGAFIGSWLQYRLWNNQYNAQMLEKDRAEAMEVFKRVSTQLDKRFYSMDKLVEMMKKEEDDEAIKKQWELYLSHTVEYNQQRNQNGALLDWYFGTEVIDKWAPALFKEFRDVEAKIESLYKTYITDKEKRKSLDYPSVEKALNDLNTNIYGINDDMITLIKKGEVGRFNNNRQ